MATDSVTCGFAKSGKRNQIKDVLEILALPSEKRESSEIKGFASFFYSKLAIVSQGEFRTLANVKRVLRPESGAPAGSLGIGGVSKAVQDRACSGRVRNALG